MSDFTKAFTAQEETFDQSRLQSQSLLQEGEQAGAHWLTTHTMLVIGMIPILHNWVTDLRAMLKPIRLWPVYLQRHWLRRYTRVTWWHPHGFRLRTQIGYLWLLIQYERLCDWLLAVYRMGVRWCIRHQRQLISAVIVIGVILLLYLWVRLTFFIWERLFATVRTFWERIFGS